MSRLAPPSSTSLEYREIVRSCRGRAIYRHHRSGCRRIPPPPAATGPARGSVPRQRRSEGCEPRATRLDRDAATPPHVHLDSVLPAGGGRLRTLTRARTPPGRARPGALADGLAARHSCAHPRGGLHPAAGRRSLGRLTVEQAYDRLQAQDGDAGDDGESDQAPVDITRGAGVGRGDAPGP